MPLYLAEPGRAEILNLLFSCREIYPEAGLTQFTGGESGCRNHPDKARATGQW